MSPSNRGFTLLESLLALAIFSLAGGAIVTAINRMGTISIQARQDRGVERALESLLLENEAIRPLLAKTVDPPPGPDGIRYQVKTEPANLRDQQGKPLAGLWRLEATATWQENGRPVSLSAESMVFE